jgi:GNAT superfamily N-acetyltransferase
MFVDRALSARMERCEGAVCAAFVEVSAREAPERGAASLEVEGTAAMYDGADSPMTQSFGLGLTAPVSTETLEVLEHFFQTRGAPAVHELSPLAGVGATAALVARGYRPVEQTSVLVRALDPLSTPPAGVEVAVATPPLRAAWVAASVRGWSDDPTTASVIEAIARRAFDSPRMTSVFVAHAGEVVATASLGLHEGVALLGGASTCPEFRGRGAQRALLAHRLQLARTRGATLAIMGAEPGSTSQRNAQRAGFSVAYTRTKWRLDQAP